MRRRRTRISHVVLAALMLLTFTLPPATLVAYADHWSDAAAIADRATSLPPAEENVSQAVCAPRPAIQLATTKIGEKDFQVTVTAGRGNLELIRFGAAPTVRLDLPGRGTGITPPLDYKPPTAAPTVTFVLHATGVGSTVTLPLTVFDGCGQNYPWPTFVGGGSGATVVQLSIADATVVEGDSGTTNMTFTVSLSSVASVPVTVGWSTGAAPPTGLAAASNSDYVSASGVLTFVPGETTKTIVVQIVGDLANEPTKTFAVTLANPTNASIGRGIAVGTIVDNDGLPSLSVNDTSIGEGNSGSQSLQFTVTLSPPSGQTVTVQYATANDTATAGSDYTATSGTLTFAPGQTTQPVSVQVTGDTTTEPNERFFVNLTSPTNATIAKSQGSGTITNDDATPVVTLGVSGSPFSENGGQATVTATLSNPTTLPVTVDLGFGGSATQGTDYTPSATQIAISALQTTGSITLTGVNDAVFEGPETVQVTITGATNAQVGSPNQVAATISEDDASPTVSWTAAAQTVPESVGTVTVTATLSAAAALDVTVPFTVGGTATQGAGQDFTLTPNSIVIPKGSTTGVTTITVLDDASGEPSETVTLQIGAPTNATIGSPSLFTLTITDNDGPVVTTTAGATAFAENGAAVVVDGGVTVTSPGVNLVSASVVITNPLDGAAESLASTAAPVGGITSSYDAPTHTLSFTGSGTAAQYQSLLQGVTYANTSDNPTTTARSISFQVTNVTLLSGSASKSVTIGASNDAPTLTSIEGTPLAYAENDPPTSITASIAVGDVDSPSLASAKVQITANCAPAEDVLALPGSPLNGITGTYTAATCTLSLTGSASPANYQTALRAVTYSNSSNNPSTLARTVSFTVNDGTASSPTLTRSITVGSANDAPTVTPSGATAPTFTEGGAAVLVDSGITVTDPDSATLASATITLTTNPDGAFEGLDVDLTGLVGLSKGGSGTATLTLTGPAGPSVFQSAFQLVKYSNSLQAPTAGSRTITFVASDGSVSSTPATTSVTVVAVNDAPANSVPAAQNVNQGAVLTLSTANTNAISIGDLDAGSSPVQVTLTATNGTLSLNGTVGLSFAFTDGNGTGAGDGTADATMTFRGTLSAINTALNGLTFTPTGGYSGAASVQVVTNDLGNTGTGGPLSDTDSVNITVVAQNQAPVNNVPAATQTVAEDDTLTFSVGNSNLISISDTDAGVATVQVALTATNGVMSLSGTSGLSFVFSDANGTGAGDGTSDATMTFRGTISAIDTALAGLTFTPTANYSGPASIQIVTNDLGNTGPGGAKSDTDSVTISVTAVNDAPVITRPATIAANEDQTFTFNAGNVISIADVDAASGSLTITLSVSSGVLTLSGTAGLTGVSGNGTASIAASGTLTNLNAALNGMTYRGNTDFSGSDTLNIGVDDNGNTGSGGNQTDSKSVGITVTATNDPPVNTVPGTQTFDEDTTLTFSTANGNAISVADVDAGSGTLTVTLSTTAGTLAFGSTTNLTSVTNNAATVVATGTIANLNAGLQGTVFTPTLNVNGAQTISMTTNDNGNTGGGGAQTDTDTINLSIIAVNDAPTLTNPASFTVNEDQTFTLNAGNVVSVADVDAGGGSVKISLDVLHGKINLAGVVGLTFVDATANNSGSVHFTGTVSAVNTALNGMTYQGNANYNGSDTLSIVVNDQGNTGTGGPLTDSGSVSITVTPVNDAPTANAFTNLPAQASIKIIYPAAKLGGTDVEDGTAVTIDTTPINVTNGTVVIRSDGGFDFTPDPDAAGGSASFQYRVTDSGIDSTVSGAPLNSAYVTVSFSVAGPELYFVKTAGSGNCTLGNECTLATALTNIGSRTNVRIFVNDAGTYSNTVSLTANSWLTSQGATGTTFDTLFSISAPAQGTLATRPTLGQSRPTLSGANATVTMNNSSQVRGVVINVSAGSNKGLVATNATGTLTVTDTDVTSAGGNAIDLSNTSVDFTGGGLSVVSTSGNGFEATSGGTITVQGTGNTISTGSGIALNVSSTSIGSAGLTFQSISANGGTNGIVLSSTGSSGGLTVTGDGVNATQGGNGSGGTIQNTTGVGVDLNNTRSVNLNYLNVTEPGTHGIQIQNINGFTLNRSTISDSTGVAQQWAVAIGDFSTGTAVNGTIAITNSVIGPNTGNAPHNLVAAGIGSGTSTWSITGSKLQNNGNAAINVELRNAAVVSSMTISGNSFPAVNVNSAEGIHIQPAGGATGSLTATIHNNTFANQNIAIDVNGDASATTTYTITSNSIVNDWRNDPAPDPGSNTSSHGINVFLATTSSSSAVMNVRLEGNTIGDANIAGSGSSIGNGMRININGNGQARVLLNNNTIRQAPVGRGIEIIGRNGTGQLDVTVTNNNVDHTNLTFDTTNGSNFPLGAIVVQSNCVTVCYHVRSDVRGNTVPTAGGSLPAASEVTGKYLSLEELSANPNPPGGTSTHELVDNAPASANASAELQSHNTGDVGANAGVSLIAGPINTPP